MGIYRRRKNISDFPLPSNQLRYTSLNENNWSLPLHLFTPSVFWHIDISIHVKISPNCFYNDWKCCKCTQYLGPDFFINWFTGEPTLRFYPSEKMTFWTLFWSSTLKYIYFTCILNENLLLFDQLFCPGNLFNFNFNSFPFINLYFKKSGLTLLLIHIWERERVLSKLRLIWTFRILLTRLYHIFSLKLASS